MSCLNPLLAVDNGLNSEGKHDIKFVGYKHPEWDLAKFRSFYGDKLMMLPSATVFACALSFLQLALL